MNRLFTKSDKKPKKSSVRDSDEEPASPHSPKPRSPLKKPAAAKAGRADDENNNNNPSPNLHKSRSDPAASSHKSSRSSTSSKPSHGSRRKADLDFDTHPLNLSEAERKRLSVLSMMSDPMEVDSEGPVSPPPPQASVPGAFDAPAPTAANGTAPVNGEGPAPPPHKSNPSSPAAPAAPTPEDAEAFKAAGNKFYKEKNYKKAIEEYTKGTRGVNVEL